MWMQIWSTPTTGMTPDQAVERFSFECAGHQPWKWTDDASGADSGWLREFRFEGRAIDYRVRRSDKGGMWAIEWRKKG